MSTTPSAMPGACRSLSNLRRNAQPHLHVSSGRPAQPRLPALPRVDILVQPTTVHPFARKLIVAPLFLMASAPSPAMVHRTLAASQQYLKLCAQPHLHVSSGRPAQPRLPALPHVDILVQPTTVHPFARKLIEAPQFLTASAPSPAMDHRTLAASQQHLKLCAHPHLCVFSGCRCSQGVALAVTTAEAINMGTTIAVKPYLVDRLLQLSALIRDISSLEPPRHIVGPHLLAGAPVVCG